MIFKKSESILNEIYKKKRLSRYIEFSFGVIIIALAFNIFLLPGDIVFGVSGIGVILNKLFNVEPAIVILLVNSILLIFSLKFLGKQTTRRTMIGSLLYPIMVLVTAPLIKYVDLSTAEPLVMVLFGAILMGLGTGIIYKSGFTTGGIDILNQIIFKYAKISMGNAMVMVDAVIIFASIFVFGWTIALYSVITIYIISMLTDRVTLGISKSKAFYIITVKEKEVQNFIVNELKHSVTLLEGRGGFSGNRQTVLMCVIPTNEYFILKEGIHKLDEKSFFIVTDSYEVYGGE